MRTEKGLFVDVGGGGAEGGVGPAFTLGANADASRICREELAGQGLVAFKFAREQHIRE